MKYRVTLLLMFMNIGICLAQHAGLKVHHLGANHTLIQVLEPQKYLLLPIEEAAPEATVNVLVNNHESDLERKAGDEPSGLLSCLSIWRNIKENVFLLISIQETAVLMYVMPWRMLVGVKSY